MEESGIKGQREEGKEVSQGSPVPGMVLCTGLTERGPKEPEVETWAGTEAGSEHWALREDKSHPAGFSVSTGHCERINHIVPLLSHPFWGVLAPRDTSPTPGAPMGTPIHIPE